MAQRVKELAIQQPGSISGARVNRWMQQPASVILQWAGETTVE